MERVSFRLPEDLLDEVQAAVDAGVFPNRSEAIRSAIRSEFPPEDGGGADGDDIPEVMTDGGTDRDGVRVSDGAPELHPFVDVADDVALTEVVVEADAAPSVVREYRGTDTSNGQPHARHVALIKGGATREQDRPVEFQINEDRALTRIVVAGTETAVGVLKSVLSSGEYERVGGDDGGV